MDFEDTQYEQSVSCGHLCPMSDDNTNPIVGHWWEHEVLDTFDAESCWDTFGNQMLCMQHRIDMKKPCIQCGKEMYKHFSNLADRNGTVYVTQQHREVMYIPCRKTVIID